MKVFGTAAEVNHSDHNFGLLIERRCWSQVKSGKMFVLPVLGINQQDQKVRVGAAPEAAQQPPEAAQQPPASHEWRVPLVLQTPIADGVIGILLPAVARVLGVDNNSITASEICKSEVHMTVNGTCITLETA